MKTTRRLVWVCLAIGLCADAGWPAPQTPPAQDVSNVARKKAEKHIAFEVNEKPWKQVFDWLTEQTGLPFIVEHIPAGACTFKPPKSDQPRLYTIPDVFDIINDGLAPTKHLLIRRGASIILVSADESIPPGAPPRIQRDDLPSYGRTEIVSLVVRSSTLDALELAAQVKKMLGPWGTVIPLETGGQIILSDTRANVERVLQLVDQLEKGGPVTLAYKCVRVRATQALSMLEELVGGSPKGKFAAALRMTADKRTNTILLHGSPGQIDQAKTILAKIDVAVAGQEPLALGPPMLKSYTVPDGQAEVYAVMLRKIFPRDVEITAAGRSTLLVWADPEDQFTIARNILSAAPQQQVIELIPLATLEAARVVDMLRAMDSKAPFLDADPQRNALIVRGTKEQVAEVKAVLQVLGEGKAGPAGRVRVFTLREGSAPSLAEAIRENLRALRPNPVRIITPGEKGSKPAMDNGAQKKVPGEVVIFAFGNKVIVECDDPQVLQLVAELLRLYTSSAVVGDLSPLPLKHASAVDVAKILDEAFNGPADSGAGFGTKGSRGLRVQRVRIVADPSTNSLLIRATPLDLLMIRKMLAETLDIEAVQPALRTYVFGPFKHAKADEMVKVVRDLYREHAPRFSVTADPRTNSLVLRATAALGDEIQALVARLDMPKNP